MKRVIIYADSTNYSLSAITTALILAGLHDFNVGITCVTFTVNEENAHELKEQLEGILYDVKYNNICLTGAKE